MGEMRVSTADFIKGYGTLADQALTEPVTIIKDGRDRLVLLSASEYARLTRRGRRALLAKELTEGELTAIGSSEMEAGHEHLNEELQGWQS